MVKRVIKNQILKSLECWPITLIVGPKQCGKTTLCKEIAKQINFKFVSLDDLQTRKQAIENPTGFIKSLGNKHIIIDEIQYAPKLFDVIVSIVNKNRLDDGNADGMFIINMSVILLAVKNLEAALAGRVNIIDMPILSYGEINNQKSFNYQINKNDVLKRKDTVDLSWSNLSKILIKGFYPKVFFNNKIDLNQFYSDYLNTYIEDIVKYMIELKEEKKFIKFLKLLAIYSGKELDEKELSKNLKITRKKLNEWLGTLIGGKIIDLIDYYFWEHSLIDKISRNYMIQFCDTGLLCYLLDLKSVKELNKSIYKENICKTFIYNEIKKSFVLNDIYSNIYFYKHIDGNEIDYIIKGANEINLIKVKYKNSSNAKDSKAFNIFDNLKFKVDNKLIITFSSQTYQIKNDVLVLPYYYLI